MGHFNLRVYGILVNGEGKVLVSDEREYGAQFTKFPGGGLEYGEGLKDGLIREFREECGTDIVVEQHIHTTDVFFKSAFNESQIIGVYYLVRNLNQVIGRFSDKAFDFGFAEEPEQVFRWVPVDRLRDADLTFEMDRAAWRVFLSEKRHELNF